MALVINHVIVHKLEKEQETTVASVVDGVGVLDSSNATVMEMVEGINKVYGKKENYVQYGSFHDSGYLAPTYFSTYLTVEADREAEFITLSKNIMEQLKITAADKFMATGGYVVFTDFTQNGVNYFLIAMVKDKSGITFDANLVPQSIERIDLERLHQAFKVNFRQYSEFNDAESEEEKGKINYLSFIAKSNSASGYFIKALGSKVGNSSIKSTSLLIDEVFKFAKESANRGVFTKNGKEVQEDLCNYLREVGDGNPVNIDQVRTFLGGYFTPQAENTEDILDEFIGSLNSSEKAIPYSFAVSVSSVNKKSRIFIKSSQWDLKFDRKLLGTDNTNTIYYDSSTKKVIIDVSDEPNIVKLLNEETSEQALPNDSNE